MSSTSVVHSCTVCDKENATFCAHCKSTSYCSKTCQKRDWSIHKLLCASFPTFAASKRPTADHIRAVLFDPNKEKPEFIWLLCKWIQGDDDEIDFQMPEVNTIMGSDAFIKQIPFQYNPRLKRPLPNTITNTYRDTFMKDGSQPNKSIASITATQPGEYYDWRGPIIVYAQDGVGLDPPACKDFDMVDFRHSTDYFLTYGYIPPKAQASIEIVKGVRMNCLGDIKMLKRPQFEEIELPATDAIFANHDTSDIANRIGIPILTQRCPPDPKWADSEFSDESFYDNQDAFFLHKCLDPTAKSDIKNGSLGWGWCNKSMQERVGSVNVVRKDKKPLFPPQMEALARYCRNEIQPLLAHSMGEYAPEEPIEKGDVLKIICRPMFVIYWDKFTEETKNYTTPSPYDSGL